MKTLLTSILAAIVLALSIGPAYSDGQRVTGVAVPAAERQEDHIVLSYVRPVPRDKVEVCFDRKGNIVTIDAERALRMTDDQLKQFRSQECAPRQPKESGPLWNDPNLQVIRLRNKAALERAFASHDLKKTRQLLSQNEGDDCGLSGAARSILGDNKDREAFEFAVAHGNVKEVYRLLRLDVDPSATRADAARIIKEAKEFERTN
jgi:hypothetical protein